MNKRKKVIIGIIILCAGWFVYTKYFKTTAAKTTYQTALVEKGTLVVSVTASGQVSTANNVAVSTQASGVVKNVYVKNDDMVKTGDPIMELESDLAGRQRATAALASYQGAKNSYDSAQANLYTSHSDLFTNWQKYVNLAKSAPYQNGDETPNTDNRLNNSEFIISHDGWLAAEAKYKIQQQAIIQSQTSLSSAWLSYQQSSPVIYAPISGKVTGLSYQVGSVLNAQSNTSGTASSQKIASITTDAPPTVTVSMTEIDIPKIVIGNKATVILDAFPDKTFTGKVVSLDTVGSVSSGVTSYNAIIQLDSQDKGILPNMSAQASIITNIKDNALLVPVAAVTDSIIQVMKNGKPTDVQVTVGLSSDTQTEIVSGISEGDTVVTGTNNSATSTSTQTSSPFSAFGGNRGMGGAVRMGR